jgi:hypothetical protein
MSAKGLLCTVHCHGMERVADYICHRLHDVLSTLVRILAEAEMQGYREEKRKLMQLPALYLFGTKLLPDE